MEIFKHFLLQIQLRKYVFNTTFIQIRTFENYFSKKLKMEKKKKGSPVDERQLFHGTSSQYVDAICRQGFDFRLSGQSSGR